MHKPIRRIPLSKVRKHYMEERGRQEKFREHARNSPKDSCRHFGIPTHVFCTFDGRHGPKVPRYFFEGRVRDMPVHVDFTSGRTIYFVRYKGEMHLFMGYGPCNELIIAPARYLDLNR